MSDDWIHAPWTRRRVLAAVSLAVALVLLGVVGWQWRQALNWWTLVWWLFALLAVRASRPEFAAAAVPPAMTLQPIAGLPLVALATLTAAGLGPRPPWIEPEEAQVTGSSDVNERIERQAVTALPPMLAVLATGLVWHRPATAGHDLVALAIASVAAAVTLRAGEMVQGRRLTVHRGEAVHLGWWLTALAWGQLLAMVSTTAALWVAVGLAVLLAVRREGAWEGRVAGEAVRRSADVPAWVQRAYALVLQATHCSWFELRLAIDGAAERWSAGEDQELRPGAADPPPRPSVRLGIHRRPRWINERRILQVADGDLEVIIWRDPRRVPDATLEEQLDELSRIVAAGRFESAVANLPGGRLVDRQRVLELLGGAFASARESGDSVSIALVGLDHARELQEVHGAECCEQAVSAVGGVFEQLLGSGDAVCRYGGEEFLLLFLGRDGRQAMEVGSAIREQAASIDLAVEGEPTPVTVSVGVAAHPEVYVERPSELIPLADSALYEARRRGGNGLLLATGRGRFEDSSGQAVEGSAESREIAAPRLFV